LDCPGGGPCAGRGGPRPTHQLPGAPPKLQPQFSKRCLQPPRAWRRRRQQTELVCRSCTCSAMALQPQLMRAWVPSTHVPSGWTDPLGPMASEALPVSIYPPPIFVVVGGEYDGVDAAGRAGEGAIDPFAKRLDGPARADGIGGTAVGQFPPPLM
jgi:hypothetical protein